MKSIEKKKKKTIMSNINICLDIRESKLISVFDNNHIEIEKKRLEIGDIEIKCDKNVNILIERKTVADLLASIKDGRYKEQKLRLEAMKNQDKITDYFYIIEGSSYFLNSGQKIIYNGAIISIQLRDNIQLVKTDSINDTFDFILRLISRLKKQNIFIQSKVNRQLSNKSNDDLNSESNINQTNYLENIKIVKKENIQAREAQILAFSNIPGISVKVGEAIITKWNTLSELVDAYFGLETEEEKEQILANIQINEKRKIGSKKSKKIYEYLFKL